MKTLNFAVEMEVETFYKSQSQEILVISIGDECIGFTCVNKTTSNEIDSNNTFTPFTQHGVLADENCLSCVLSMLFSIRTSIDEKRIKIAEANKNPTREIIAALIKSAKKDIH